MLAQHFGRLIKGQRDLAGITQSDLASRARVSRSVLSRLEGCKAQPVQTDVLDRLLEALALQPRISSGAGPDAERMQARFEQRGKRDQQRVRHLRLAIELASDEHRAAGMVDKARERVDLWRTRRSCSPAYIDRWSEILALPPRGMATAMASLGDWEDAMFQNTPWSWAWS